MDVNTIYYIYTITFDCDFNDVISDIDGFKNES